MQDLSHTLTNYFADSSYFLSDIVKICMERENGDVLWDLISFHQV